MNTHICQLCGRDPLVDPRTILTRVNPLGVTPAVWRCQDCVTKHEPDLILTMAALVAINAVRPVGMPNYPTVGLFRENPLPWRYDQTTRNVVAANGSIVCRVGDSVYGDPAIGELIVCQANALGFVKSENWGHQQGESL